MPPGTAREGVARMFESRPPSIGKLLSPEIILYCDSSICNGQRIFVGEIKGREVLVPWRGGGDHCFLLYTCRHCQITKKIFAVYVANAVPDGRGTAIKIGESPPFGAPTPPRVISLIGPNRDLFLNGRRAENQGLGIGAFAYYRRVVENQKDHIFNEIIKIAKRIGAKEELLEELTSAKADFRFDRAIDTIKTGIPESLKVRGGHNPLTLLHSALSKGLHQESDTECLKFARSIRLILTDLAERIDLALKEQKDLNEAVALLLDKSKPNDI